MPDTDTPRTSPAPSRLLTGPGPSNVDPRVTAAMAMPLVGHLDPFFLQVMTETMEDLRRVYRTAHHHTIPMSGTGTSGIETIMTNLLEPGEEAIVGVIGFFGGRMAETARRTGATVRVLEAPLGQFIAPERFEEELKRKPAKLVALVHAETSTGVLQPVREVAEIAHRHGALIAIDCVTSLGGLAVEIDAWDIDAAGSCSQKCIGSPPGLAPVTFSRRAIDIVHARGDRIGTLYLDLNLLFKYWGENGGRERAFHHTAPIASMYAFREALRLVVEEGLDARWARHRAAAACLVSGLERLGLEVFTPPAHRLPQLTVVTIPAGVDDRRVRGRMLEMGIEIGSGFGPLNGKAWRIGLMGYNAHEATAVRVLGALEEVLRAEGWKG